MNLRGRDGHPELPLIVCIFSSAPPSTIMTGNTTQLMMVSVIDGLSPERATVTRDRLRQLTASVAHRSGRG